MGSSVPHLTRGAERPPRVGPPRASGTKKYPVERFLEARKPAGNQWIHRGLSRLSVDELLNACLPPRAPGGAARGRGALHPGNTPVAGEKLRASPCPGSGEGSGVCSHGCPGRTEQILPGLGTFFLSL